MSRYQPTAERRAVQAMIDAEVERARVAQAASGDSWITYLVRDPTKPDKRGNLAGWPFYVGQTKQFPYRVRDHFTKCEKNSKSGLDSIERRLAELLHRDVVARFEVLEVQPTRLASLLSETNWARRCVRRGYKIANKLALQRENGPDIERQAIPTDWLWRFSLEEGVQDGLQAEIGCARCMATLTIDLDFFQSIQRPPKELRDIRDDAMWRKEPCVCCGQLRARYATIRIP